MEDTHDPPAAGKVHDSGRTDPQAPAADAQDLADRVYRLMLADLRLDAARARGGSGVREN